MVTINLKVGMCRYIITNSNITKAFVIYPCVSYNTVGNTTINTIHDVHCHRMLIYSDYVMNVRSVRV